VARFDTSGLDDVLAEMKELGQLTGEVADTMLMAGAEIVAQCWKEAAERHRHRLTGDMIASIGYPRQPSQAGDVRMIDIYPQGRDSTGTRNAEKAFILHYGTSKIPGSHWIDDADALAGPRVEAKWREIWNDYLSKR